MESTNHCLKCHQPLKPGAAICPNCGMLAPGIYLFESSHTPASSASSHSRRGVRFWLGLVLTLGGLMTSCLAVVVILLTFSNGQLAKPGPSQTSEQAIAQPVSQPAAVEPAKEITSPAQVPNTPVKLDKTPTKSSVNTGTTQFTDDFSNVNSGWEEVFQDNFTKGYFQQGNYSIKLNVPQNMVIAFPPYPFKKPIKNTIVSVKVRGSGGNGFYGLLCHYQDQYNYYRASFSGDQYALDKVVNSKRTELTQPYWKKIVGYQPDGDYMTLTMACVDGRVQLLVNDVGQEIITSEDLDQGDTILFAASGDKKDAEGVFEQAFFDDFSAQLQP
jgi:hypothetical protein